jgi:hypothetical protein
MASQSGSFTESNWNLEMFIFTMGLEFRNVDFCNGRCRRKPGKMNGENLLKAKERTSASKQLVSNLHRVWDSNPEIEIEKQFR